MNGKSAHADAIGPQGVASLQRPARHRVAPRDLIATMRALWASLRRAHQVPGRPGGLAELDARVLKDIGYTRSDALGVATRHLPADDVARYRDEL